VRLSNHCYAVTGLGYFTPWCVNAGFVIGETQTLIIDTGANTLAARTIHGYASAVKPGNQIRVINTEKHFDHIGGNSFFRELGIDVWGHVGIARTAAEFQAEVSEFHAFFHDTQLANPNLPIDQDCSFDLGGCTVQVLLTPGHTPTNISVWIPEDRVLYTGDCLINQYSPNLSAGTRDDWRVWLDSLNRLEALQPTVVVAGHGQVAEGTEVQTIIDTVRKVLVKAIAETGADAA
jgi:glyoxylase-like metal-dependent hydrolase (beta-lactamase superfamily II)